MCQNLNTNPSQLKAEIDAKQVGELFKIGKQNEFLHKYTQELEKKQEAAMKAADKVISEQKKQINTLKNLNAEQEALRKNEADIMQTEINQRDAQIDLLSGSLLQIQKESKKEGRKKFWRGVTVGGVTVGVLGSLTTIFIISR